MRFKKLTLLIIFVIFGLLIYYRYNNQNNEPYATITEKTNSPQTANPTSPPLGTAIAFDNFFVHFRKDEVFITSFSPDSNIKGGILKQSDYPELFRAEGGGEFFITAKELNDKIHNKQFVYISKNVFSHGAYVDVYGIIFDPNEGTVAYVTPDELRKSSLGSIQFIDNNSVVSLESYAYYFHDACTSCKLRLIDYKSYDPKLKKFVSANSRYIIEFKALLKEYEEIAKNRCSYNGKFMPVTEVQKIAGDNAKCDDLTLPSEPRKAPEYYATVGEFLKIMESIQQVINGQKESIIATEN